MNENLIARKERWARKMANREPRLERGEDRLPPGQKLVHNWPVLDLGLQP